MASKRVTVFGGSGFLGRQIVKSLAAEGVSIRVAVRHPERAASHMANNGLPGHVAGTSASPPTADLRVSMSGFMVISSASPSGADLAGSIAECLFPTHCGRRGLSAATADDVRCD